MMIKILTKNNAPEVFNVQKNEIFFLSSNLSWNNVQTTNNQN